MSLQNHLIRDSRRRQQVQAVEKWNQRYPVGTPVVVLLDSGESRETKTRSEAQMLSGHSAVIWLEGISGCYTLERVSAQLPTQPSLGL